MTYYLILWLSSAIFLYITALIVPGFKISSFPRAMLAALVLGFFNASVKPFLLFISFPITFLTLGVFAFVISAVILRLSAAVMKGFDISGWIPAFLGALVLAALQMLSHDLPFLRVVNQ